MAGAKSAGYKLATYKSSDGPRAGIIVGNDVFDAAKLTGKAGYATVMGILADWKAAEPALKKAAAGAAKSRAKRQPLAKTKLLAPLRFPSAIYCAGANYGDHAAEMAAKEGNPPPPDPHTLGHKAWHFLKAAGAITDPGATVQDFQLCQKHGLGDRDGRRHRQDGEGHPAEPRRCPTSPAIPSPTTFRPATAAAGPVSLTPRRSSGTGPSTRLLRAPVRSDRGSCRQATSATRKSSG